MDNDILYAGSSWWRGIRGVYSVVKIVKNNREDIGIRLLKIMLLRLYHMYSEIPLKWYEMLIVAILGVLMGLGFGVVIGHYLKSLVVR
jgi:hypothetical protein